MTRRPRLTLPAALLARFGEADPIRSAFDLTEVESFSDLAEASDGLVLLDADELREHWPRDGHLPRALTTILEHVGEAVGVFDTDRGLVWENAALRNAAPEARSALVTACRTALDGLNQSGVTVMDVQAGPGLTREVTVGDSRYEILLSIAAVDDGNQRVTAVLGTLWDVTASRALQSRIDAIDAAGADLLRIDTASIRQLNMAERLRLLEAKIVRSVRDLLHFDHFEVRLIDRETNQLELVVAVGLAPLRLGEVLYARAEDNGISGYVAATGEAYVCREIQRDARYYDGLPNARSSLTVPLRLNDRVIGVFNVEADTADAFDEEDRRFAELFGRYIAMAMHILDLLVVERYTTNAQAGENIIGEIDAPLAGITRAAEILRARFGTDPDANAALEEILTAAGGIRERLRECTDGPRNLLGADLANFGIDPRLDGKRIIVADNEAVTRDAIAKLLRGQGCQVTACPSGAATIDALREAASDRHPFDLVISDIRMPDGNGYDVVRSARELSATLPVILITGFGYDPHHRTVRAAEDGVAALLFKPLKAAQLLEAVATAVEPA